VLSEVRAGVVARRGEQVFDVLLLGDHGHEGSGRPRQRPIGAKVLSCKLRARAILAFRARQPDAILVRCTRAETG
jgi:hypothetical protein